MSINLDSSGGGIGYILDSYLERRRVGEIKEIEWNYGSRRRNGKVRERGVERKMERGGNGMGRKISGTS